MAEENRISVATQWQLMWWKFRKHRLAMIGGVVTALIYLTALFVEFLAPFPSNTFAAKYTYAPPQPLHLIETPERAALQSICKRVYGGD